MLQTIETETSQEASLDVFRDESDFFNIKVQIEPKIPLQTRLIDLYEHKSVLKLMGVCFNGEYIPNVGHVSFSPLNRFRVKIVTDPETDKILKIYRPGMLITRVGELFRVYGDPDLSVYASGSISLIRPFDPNKTLPGLARR